MKFNALVGAGLFLLSASAALAQQQAHGDPTTGDAPAAIVARGEYLARAGDCISCHTVPGGTPFVGGRAFTLPFGVIYSTNITPDNETGIGAWTDDQFVRAVHEGISKDGEHLYPAFPYASYTQISREDVLAIKAYLFSMPPVHQPRTANSLSFPFNQRWGMAFWNALNLDAARFKPDPGKSAEWNRGNYLANALGHCGECHTPRNVTFGLQASRMFSGAEIEGWRAYNASADAALGIGDWSMQELEQFLKTGHAENRGSASGPMEEVVRLSLSHLNDQDIHSLAVYLKDTAPVSNERDPRVAAAPSALQDGRYVPGTGDAGLGQKVFAGNCASCHSWNGGGMSTPFAGLRGSKTANDAVGSNIVQVVLSGQKANTSTGVVSMPSFRLSLNNIEIAAVANYIVGRFGDKPGFVTPEQVEKQRAGEQRIDFGPYVRFAIGGLVIIIVTGFLAFLAFRSRRQPRGNMHAH
ncbi:cytochrome c [Rhizobium calliandrae]|uniref:Cytochrome c n=1 Tax=Rhizobium calliandrae TaxID=1312182 RepID=A0ABT7KEA9_9HYPH|nr:cytochrome c [Rhizobium calliandrae]MDL2406959.1 cytochrome c [Rhizobium calliandrae]